MTSSPPSRPLWSPSEGWNRDPGVPHRRCLQVGARAAAPHGVEGVDVAFGDPILGEPEVIVAKDALGFAGIAPPTLRVYPVETHVAEKLHAYTMPRARPNSRVKDLPDIALIATAGPVEASRLRAAIDQTFAFRGTHAVPAHLPAPPATWEAPYAAIAKEDQLQWSTIAEAFEAARAFLDPVLAAPGEAVWEPTTWTWAVTRARPDNESD